MVNLISGLNHLCPERHRILISSFLGLVPGKGELGEERKSSRGRYARLLRFKIKIIKFMRHR